MSTLSKKRTVKASGFTLIELLIVIVIGFAHVTGGTGYVLKVDSTKVKTAQLQLEMFRTSLEAYRLDLGTYPSSLEELRNSSKSGWDGPYLPKSIPSTLGVMTISIVCPVTMAGRSRS